jgi:tRNA 2-thiouridine synthesizing protein B
MLHIVNKSHMQTSALQSCLRLAQPGSALLLIEDAVYAATALRCRVLQHG